MARESKMSNDSERRELVPPVDIYDTEDAIVVLADMPGVSSENLEVNVERGTLTLRGRRNSPADTGVVHLEEYRTGDYVRAFTLGDDIDSASIAAELKHGVLRLTLPKGTDRTTRKIDVKAG